MDQKMIQLVQENVKKEVEKALGFREWRKFDSVTDQFSPITGASQQIGFFGSNKVPRPSILGAKGANAALTSLINELDTLGIINDQTS